MRGAAEGSGWSGKAAALERAAREEPGFVVAVGRALREGGDGGDASAVPALYEYAWRCLALVPGIETALGTVDLAHALRRSTWDRVGPLRALRRSAAMLSQAQPPEVIFEVAERLEGRADRSTFLSLLMHESILRGLDVQSLPAFVRLARDLRGEEHPLAMLPLHRLPIEEGLSRRAWHPGGFSGGWGPEGTPRAYGPDELTRRRRGWRVADTTSDAEAIAIRSCAVTMIEESNGVAEARVFEVSPALPADEMPALLWSLDLDCLRDMTGELQVTGATARDAFHRLFGIAEMGGAYDHGLDGAWGRLMAWRAFAALAGAAPAPAPDDIAAAAEACAWRFFSAASPFFAGVAWDSAVACLRPDASLAVLAVTDTD